MQSRRRKRQQPEALRSSSESETDKPIGANNPKASLERRLAVVDNQSMTFSQGAHGPLGVGVGVGVAVAVWEVRCDLITGRSTSDCKWTLIGKQLVQKV